MRSLLFSLEKKLPKPSTKASLQVAALWTTSIVVTFAGGAKAHQEKTSWVNLAAVAENVAPTTSVVAASGLPRNSDKAAAFDPWAVAGYEDNMHETGGEMGSHSYR
jgi:hypothetical protein